jgi:hypothetical protein
MPFYKLWIFRLLAKEAPQRTTQKRGHSEHRFSNSDLDTRNSILPRGFPHS